MDPARCLCLGHRRTGRLPLSKRSRDKGNAKRRKIAVLAVAGLTPESFEVFLRSSGIGEIEQEDPPSSKALWPAGEEEREVQRERGCGLPRCRWRGSPSLAEA